MRHTTLPLFAVLAGALMSAGFACPTGPTDYCEQQLKAACHFEFTCCKDKERIQGLGFFLPYVTSEGECVDRTKDICKTQEGSIEDSISLGRIQFNGDKAAECLDALSAATDSCVASDGVVVACDEVISGLVKDGDTCSLNQECGNGGTCAIDSENPDVNKDTGATEGECQGPAAKGDDCGDVQCERGLVCDVGGNGQGTCKSAPEKGDDCIFGQCAAGLFCDTASNTCKNLKDDGDSCDTASECKTSSCTDNECGSGTCDGK